MIIGIMDSVQFMFGILAVITIGIYFFYHYSFKKALLITFISLILLAMPRLISEIYSEFKDYQYYNQTITSNFLYDTYYSHNLSPKMTNINVNVSQEHVFIEMEYESIQTNETIEETTFKRNLIILLASNIGSFTKFTQLKRVTFEVKYFDKTYAFSNIPLKDPNGEPYHKLEDFNIIKELLQENMLVSQ
jgi:hypothetical protein